MSGNLQNANEAAPVQAIKFANTQTYSKEKARQDIYILALENVTTGNTATKLGSSVEELNDVKRKAVDEILKGPYFDHSAINPKLNTQIDRRQLELNDSSKNLINKIALIADITQLNKVKQEGQLSNDFFKGNFAKEVLKNASLQNYDGLNHDMLIALANAVEVNNASQSKQLTEILQAATKSTVDDTVNDTVDAIIKRINTEDNFLNAIKSENPTEEKYNKELYGKIVNNASVQSLTKLAGYTTDPERMNTLLSLVASTDNNEKLNDKNKESIVKSVFSNKNIRKKLNQLSDDSLIQLATHASSEPANNLKDVVKAFSDKKLFNAETLNKVNPKALKNLANNVTNIEQLNKIAEAKQLDGKALLSIIHKAEELGTQGGEKNTHFWQTKSTKDKIKSDAVNLQIGEIINIALSGKEKIPANQEDLDKISAYIAQCGIENIKDLNEIFSTTESKADSKQTAAPAQVLEGLANSLQSISPPLSPQQPDPSSPAITAAQLAAEPMSPSTGSFTDQATNSPKKNVTEYFQGLDSDGFKALGLEGYKYEDKKILNTADKKTAMETKDDGSVSFPTENGKLDAGQIRLFKEAIKKACKDATEEDKTVISINGILEEDVGKILQKLKEDPEFIKIRNNVEFTSDNTAIKTKIDTDLPLSPTSPALAVVDSTTPPPPTPRHSAPF